ncbi:class I SAM-dependent methyltransferase [Pectinatus frisingensis]|uniref:class I SAM-dependent methyltransferase n=1 Tax=Pectinatus frisingensis TaxID=865 RepID=UPI0018C838E1|nr:class I SAM-dependent methyltransferase [Pectinatus frisingensis]
MEIGMNNEAVREQWITEKINGLAEGLRILDAGAGELKHKPICKHLKYVSQDFAQYDGKGNNSGLQTTNWDTSNVDIVGDIVDIPEPDGSFDVILCTEVLEHLPDPQMAIREFSRLLTSGGKLILTAPFCSLTHFAPYHFASGFNEYWYRNVLEKYKFRILELNKNGNYFEYIAQELRRLDNITEKYAATNLNVVDKGAIKYLLKRLEKINIKDSGSDEVLFFGCQLLAEKVV